MPLEKINLVVPFMMASDPQKNIPWDDLVSIANKAEAKAKIQKNNYQD